MEETPAKPIRKPVVINPLHCRPIQTAQGVESSTICTCCAKPARWFVPPEVESLIKQVEANDIALVPMCNICTMYKSVLFKGLAARLTSFTESVEKEAKTRFKRKDGKIVEEADALRIVSTIWMTSYYFSQQEAMKAKREQAESS